MSQDLVALVSAQFADALETMRAADQRLFELTGRRALSPERPSITDATRADLERMLAQVLAGEHALRLALGWVVPGSTLGNLMKTIPSDAADQLATALTAAGLLPAQGEF